MRRQPKIAVARAAAPQAPPRCREPRLTRHRRQRKVAVAVAVVTVAVAKYSDTAKYTGRGNKYVLYIDIDNR